MACLFVFLLETQTYNLSQCILYLPGPQSLAQNWPGIVALVHFCVNWDGLDLTLIIATTAPFSRYSP